METFLVGLALAAISGAAILAFTEPEIFRYFYPTATLVLLVAVVATFAWELAILEASSAAFATVLESTSETTFDKYSVAKAVQASIKDRELPFGWIVGGAFAALIYLSILRSIPDIRASMSQPKHKHKNGDDEGEG